MVLLQCHFVYFFRIWNLGKYLTNSATLGGGSGLVDFDRQVCWDNTVVGH